MSNPFQSPFSDAIAVPDSSGDNVTQRGGEDLGADTPKETPNGVSGLPTLPMRYGPSAASSVELPDLMTADRTIKTGK